MSLSKYDAYARDYAEACELGDWSWAAAAALECADAVWESEGHRRKWEDRAADCRHRMGEDARAEA